MKKHAEICPVCKGKGVYIEYFDCNHTASTYTQHTCHGCSGTGWVTVTDDDTPDIPYYNPYGRTYLEKRDNSTYNNTEFCEYYMQHKIKYPDGSNHYVSCDYHIPYID